MTFDEAFKRTLAFEGGYVNDPDDPGGETNYGISKGMFPGLDIKNLTLEQAKKIYWQYYWVAAKCDLVPDRLRGIYFDMAVQHGVSRAVKLMQEAVNKSGRGNLAVDGILGLRTFAALDGLTEEELREHRTEYYRRLIDGRPRTFAKYERGWMRRAREV